MVINASRNLALDKLRTDRKTNVLCSFESYLRAMLDVKFISRVGEPFPFS
jgi:hypothetical protein